MEKNERPTYERKTGAKLKKIFIPLGFILLLAGISLAETDDAEQAESTELTEQYQAALIQRLEFIKGLGPAPEEWKDLEHPICGTPTGIEYFANMDRLAPVYKSAAANLVAREELPFTYNSPAGHFKIHYESNPASNNAVYGSQPLIDTIPLGGDGVPDYVNKFAQIADSVWEEEVNVLGFPAPPSDDFRADNGGDGRYDIYILGLSSAIYGQTFKEIPEIDAQTTTSFIEMDNDYDFYPYNQYDGTPQDFNRRLDAVRVTLAHEFNHAIHFTMDYTEYEGPISSPRVYWWEMSAVAMEEICYDDVNDYYGYLPYYFRSPNKSLRYFTSGTLFPYGAGIFPIFLVERFNDPAITRKIWERCRDLGVGPDFPIALNQTIQEESGGALDAVDIFREFSIWNIFTGSRAGQAPPGYGYSERANYPAIPDTAMFRFNEYPIIYTQPTVIDTFGVRRPEVFAANYIDFYNLSLIADSFRYRFVTVNTNAVWNLSLVAFPLDGVSEATVFEHRYVEGNPPYDTINVQYYPVPNHTDYLHLVAIPTPISLSFTETNYGNKFTYSFAVLDTVAPGDTAIIFFDPYPNPAIVTSGDNQINFRIQTPAFDLSPGDYEVMIFNPAGEKVNQTEFTNWNGIYMNASWDMKNQSGQDVASGVYLAFVRLTFHDGRPEVTKKFKLAVIR